MGEEYVLRELRLKSQGKLILKTPEAFGLKIKYGKFA